VVAGSVLLADSWAAVFKLAIIWLAVQVASTISCYLVAGAARKRKVAPWK
jgi:multisubunit Na+/H+ antiporter MnhG subunit